MSTQGYPASGSRYGGHPGVSGYPVAGARYGSHPASGPPAEPVGTLQAVAGSAQTDFTGTFTSNLPLAPLTISPGWTVFYVADVGLGDVAGTLTWTDQSGSTLDATQATASVKPTITTGLLNGRPGLTSDGTDDHLLISGLNLPAPGTTPVWIFSVWKMNANTVGKNLYAASSTTMRLLVNTGPNMQKHNGTAVGTIACPVAGTWVRSEDYYSASASDYYKIGATSQTTASAGNNDAAAGAFRIFANNAGGLGSPNGSMVAFGIKTGAAVPTGPEKADLDAWVTAMWGGSVVV